MNTNLFSPPAAAGAAAIRRLTGPGYRAPLLLGAVLAVVAAAPGGFPHSAATFLTAITGMFAMIPLAVVRVFPVPVGVLLLALAVAVTVASPAARRRVRRFHRPGNSALLGGLLASAAVVAGSSVPGLDYGLGGAGLAALVVLPFAWTARQLMLTANGRTANAAAPNAAAPNAAAPNGPTVFGPANGLTNGLTANGPTTNGPTAVGRTAVGRTARAGNAPRPRGPWRWALVPLAAVAAVTLAGSEVPREARLALARPALTAAAEQALDGGTARDASGWIGGLPISSAELVGGGVKFTVSGTGVFAAHGYAYFPSGVAVPLGYTPVGGHWYEWSGPDHF
ncbi:hypothetical protein [Kitasatospora sp. NPDC059599]|uniref:hypothetical protein n=1 Tax=Kitasatospora sp. NPDC059599 TaxID=3346880 RepID=UPI0036763468